MQHTKITITKEEYAVMVNADFLLKKVNVIQKLKKIFLNLNGALEKEVRNHHLPEEVLKLHGKISTGENYRNLPFIILDYPRYFDKENVFAYRCMYWWGNYFLFTLHLQGKYFDLYAENILTNLQKKNYKNIYVSAGDDPWLHHISNDNLVLFEEKKNEILTGRTFLKVAGKAAPLEWPQVEDLGVKYFRDFMDLSGADNMP